MSRYEVVCGEHTVEADTPEEAGQIVTMLLAKGINWLEVQSP